MFVKNSSMNIKHLNKVYKDYKEIIDMFFNANSIGIFEITMAYLLKNSLIPQPELYRKVHELLELNIIDIHEYSECPYCMEYNKINKNTKTKCFKCRNIYNNTNVIERFKLVKGIKNE